MINIDSTKYQKVKGILYLGKEIVDENFEGKLLLKRYNMKESSIIEEKSGILERKNWGEHRLLLRDKVTEIKISKSKGTLNQTFWSVNNLITNYESNQKGIIYSSGAINDATYYLNSKKIGSIEIYGNSISSKKREKGIKDYFSIASDKEINKNELEIIFLIISVYCGSKFFLREIVYPNNRIELIRRNHNSNSLVIYGSGQLGYPIELEKLFKLKNLVKEEFFSSILLQYASFSTFKELMSFQLISGVNLLDYFIELAEKKRGKFSGKYSSQKTFQLLEELYSDDEKNYEYLKKLFIKYPNNIKDFNNRVFAFRELRNKFVHRGSLFFEKNLDETREALFSLNEILRMIISKLDYFESKNLKSYKTIDSNKMQEVIEERNKLLGWSK
ncbi:hypothetical protein GYB29_01500 [bacterium]|nr:hypothetical protein [bacterium]